MSGALEKLRISFLGRSIDRSIDRRFNATYVDEKSGEGGGGGSKRATVHARAKIEGEGGAGIISNDKRDETDG